MTKYFYKFLVLFFIVLFTYQSISVKANRNTRIIIENYKKKQEEFIFENNPLIDSLDALNLFKSNNKINIYENVLRDVWEQKKLLEEQNLDLLKKIDDLEFQLSSVEKDIVSLDEEIKKINSNIVKTTVEITDNRNMIDEVNKEIEKNTEVLREYMAYIYKKWNLFLEDKKFNNLKTIILSGQDLDSIMSDIYFKELLAVAWKELIEKNRRLVFDLYIEKKKLEQETSSLKKLKRNFNVKKKILNDKKLFKEKILKVSKWQDSLYKKYIKQKLDTEKNLKLKAFSERVKFYATSKKVLSNSWCEFLDVSKNTPEVRTLSSKCYELNKIIFLEAELEKNKNKWEEKDRYNFFSWPVPPYSGISAYFRDNEYKKRFGTDHDAVDIIASQGTPIVAPADGYVISLSEPLDDSYAYIALKHIDWKVSVYWHVSEILVEKYDYIKSWEIFAKTWWTFWTSWAWYITTGPHLHFEILEDKVAVDPLKSLDLSYLDFKNLPEYYRLDFLMDYRERTWKDYRVKDEPWKRVFRLDWNTEIERQKSLLNKYARSDFRNWDMWVEESLRWNIDPSFMMCVWLAESSLGVNLKTPYNVWNVWNVDSWGTWTMTSPRHWIWWMGHTLNNKYLGSYNEISKLSWYGRKGNDPIYASDPVNWHRNVIKCMSTIKGQYIWDDHNFRTY